MLWNQDGTAILPKKLYFINLVVFQCHVVKAVVVVIWNVAVCEREAALLF